MGTPRCKRLDFGKSRINSDKNLTGLLFIIPVYPILSAIGKTKAYTNIHMVIAFVIVAAELAVVHITDNPVFIAMVSEVCQAFKIILLLKVIAKYASETIFQLLPKKDLLIITTISVISGVLSYLLIHPLQLNKFVFLAVSCAVCCIIFYALCWLFKLSYKDVVLDFVKNKRILKFVP